MSDDTTKATPLIERVKGKVKEIAGRVSGDDSLAREGELHQEKAGHLAEAQRFDAEAAQSAEEAELDARDRELELEQQRLADEEAAEEREAFLERERQAERSRIEQRTELRNAASGDIERAEKEAAARDEVQAVEELREDRRRAAELAAAAERKEQNAAALDVDDRP